jgi:hypothetical protein
MERDGDAKKDLGLGVRFSMAQNSHPAKALPFLL